jgi:peptidoglycan/xylan/chitin deacetylase (PgdA/CDA1 family)
MFPHILECIPELNDGETQLMRKFVLLFSFFCLFSICMHGQNLYAKQSDSLLFIVRVDDILSRNMTLLPRSIVPLQDTLSSRGAKATWGLMPHRLIEAANANGQLAREIKQSYSDGHEIAQHGLIHICQICGRSNHEMYCSYNKQALSYDQQEELILEGVQIMTDSLGIKPTSFIPPGHVYDTTTKEVLADLGFPVISTAGALGKSHNTLFDIPINAEFTWALSQQNYAENLTKAIQEIKQEQESSGIYVLMMHDPFIRLGYENGITLKWMGALLDSLNAYYGDRIQYKTLTEAAKIYDTELSTSLAEKASYSRTQPNGVSLLPNYPNPFNPSTKIGFRLLKESLINISVVTMEGRKIELITNQLYEAGEHWASLDLGHMASGNYLLLLENRTGSTSRVISLIK